MTDDDKALVGRLRPEYLIVEQWYSAMLQAADRIETLTAEVERAKIEGVKLAMAEMRVRLDLCVDPCLECRFNLGAIDPVELVRSQSK